MTMSVRASALGMPGILLLGSAVSHAQVTTAVINGTVRDPTNSAIAGTTIVAENRDTGLKRTTVTSSSGTYAFTEIPPGVYSITVTATGFKTQREQNITLAINQNSTFDFTLQLGATQQSVTVEAPRHFEFRFEAFNIFNHPTWGVPNSVLNQNNFGVISTTQSTERQLQLALKFYF